MILLWIIIPIFIIYTILIVYYWLSWRSIPVFIPPTSSKPLQLSVIIPARNEEDNIGSLLDALSHQTYPRESFEVIVVDDHSEDRTAEIVRRFGMVRLLQSPEGTLNSHKKKAIEAGIAAAKGDLIITTDADCVPQPDWLQTLVAFKQSTNSVFVAAPVAISNNTSLVQVFQAMDFMILQGITGAVVHRKALCMCNGANLAYEKKAFDEVNGFSGVDHIASGDDMLLMHKIWKLHPDRVAYVKAKEAIVTTQPVKSWKEFFRQRVRWASKARQYEDKRILPVLTVVYLLNLSFLFLVIGGFWNYKFWLGAILLWLLKTIIETPFFWSVSSFFGKEWMAKRFFLFQPLHICYVVVSGLFGQLGKYEWKGRRVR